MEPARKQRLPNALEVRRSCIGLRPGLTGSSKSCVFHGEALGCITTGRSMN